MLAAAVLAAACGSGPSETETGSGRPAAVRPVVTAAVSAGAAGEVPATVPQPAAPAAPAAAPAGPAVVSEREPVERPDTATPLVAAGDGVAPTRVVNDVLSPSDAAEEINCHWDLAQSRAFQCFAVGVPADWSQPDGPQVQIIAAARAGGDSSLPTLVVLAGGPGESILPIARPQNRQPYRQLFIAQRGGGWFDHSYDCDNRLDRVGDVTEADPAEAALIRDAFHTQCAQALVDTARVAVSGTAGHARDAAAAVAALGVDRWVVYGRGYGAAAASVLLNDPPAGLVGGVLDGPRAADWHPDSGTPLAAQTALEHLDGICNADPDCRTILAPAGVRLAALAVRLIGRYDTDPLYIEEPGGSSIEERFDVHVDGSRFAAMVVSMLATPSQAAMLPALLAGADAGIPSYEETIGLFAAEAEIAAVSDMSEGAYYLLACSEWLPAPAVSLAGTFSEAAAGRGLAADCVPWAAHTSPAPVPAAPLSTRLPVMALVGGLDPYTTPAAAASVVEAVPDAAVVEFGSLSHGTWGVWDACAQQIVAQFMRRLSADVNTGCAASAGSLRWITWS